MNTLSLDDLPPGPVLVVADNDAIARSAPHWARCFHDADRRYRVRVAGPSTIDAIQAEARSLGAVAVIWAGGSDTRVLAHATASRLGCPVSNDEILKHAQLD